MTHDFFPRRSLQIFNDVKKGTYAGFLCGIHPGPSNENSGQGSFENEFQLFEFEFQPFENEFLPDENEFYYF